MTELQSKIKQRSRFRKYGTNTLYVPLDKKTGVKLFPTKRLRDFAYNAQLKAYNAGIGPALYDKFEFDDATIKGWFYQLDHYHGCKFKTSKVYGLITQKARIPTFYISLGLDEVKSTLNKIGLRKVANDCDFNVGFINRRLVCIDFGDYG